MFKNMKSTISLDRLEKSNLKQILKHLDDTNIPSTYQYCVNNPFYRKSLDIIKEYYLNKAKS